MPSVITTGSDPREGTRMRRRMAVTAVVLGFVVAALAVAVALNPSLISG